MKNKVLRSAIVISVFVSTLVFASQEEAGVDVSSPSISPNGSQIAFGASFDGVTNIWVVNSSGTGLRKLTSNTSTDEEPSWSPSGQLIAFSSVHSGTSDIWVIAQDGSGLVRMTSALNNHQPTWAPDGSKLAFVSDRGGSKDIWSINVDGTGLTRITNLPGQENHPSYSPAGDRIAFSYTSGGKAAIYLVGAGGGQTVQLTSGFTDFNPQWTSFGIVFSSDRDSQAGHWTPWMIQPDGTGLRQLSRFAALDPVLTPAGEVLFTDEFSNLSTPSALSQVTILNVASGSKRTLINITGLLDPADVNADGVIDCSDLAVVRASFGKSYGQASFNPRADVNRDNVVNVSDLAMVSRRIPSGTVCN